MSAESDGFTLTFTEPVDETAASDPGSYSMDAWTYILQEGYGSPEVDQATPTVLAAEPAADGLSVRVRLDTITEGHIHDFNLAGMSSADGEPLLHKSAYYTVNEIPRAGTR